jgi:hypothetical protein
MTEPKEDDLAGPLDELPSVGANDLLRARTLARARARFVDEQGLVGRPWARSANRVWTDVVAPGLLVGGAAVYLIWAVQFCAALGGTGG